MNSRSRWLLVCWGCLNLLNLVFIIAVASHGQKPFPWLTFAYCAAHATIGLSALSRHTLRIFFFLPETRSELIALYVLGTGALVAGATGIAIDMRVWPSVPALLIIIFMFCNAMIGILGLMYLYGTVIAESDGPVLVHYRNLLMEYHDADAPEVKSYFEEHKGDAAFVEYATALNAFYGRFKRPRRRG